MTPQLKSAINRVLSAVLFLNAVGFNSSLSCRESHPYITYRIRVDSADLTRVDVEMRIRHIGPTVRVAMQAHPIYDDRYWRYVENLTAESNGLSLKITKEEDPVWRIDGVRGDLTVKYRIRLPVETETMRDAWKPFLSPSGGLIGDLHSFMYVIGHTPAPAQVTLELPTGWDIASGLEPTKDPQTFAASSVELLLDSPIVVGHFRQWDFTRNGVPNTHPCDPLPLPINSRFPQKNHPSIRTRRRRG